MADDKGLEDFLSKVDEVDSLVKGLTHQEGGVNDALKKADDYINKHALKPKRSPVDNTGVNRTVVNHAAFKDDPREAPNTDGMDQEAFMKVLEVDAAERRERRLKQRAEATVYKDEGNVHFKEGRYEKAVELYTKALSIVKDLTAVWTNRAQAYIKLGQYEEALNDCDWALRVDEKCLKAYIHRGRTYLAQKQYDEAITAYNEALNVDPTKENTIKRYIEEVERNKTVAEQEEAAHSFLETGTEGATALVGLLQRIRKGEQRGMYYSGGLRVIAQSLTDDMSRTLFRTEGGLELTNSHTYIAKCWCAKPQNIDKEETDMLVSLLELYVTALNENAENQRRLMCEEGFTAGLLRWGETKNNRASRVRAAVMHLLYDLSQHDFGLKLITETVDMDRLLGVVFSMGMVNGQTAVHALCCLNNLSRHKQFQSNVRPIVEERILVPCEFLMTNAACQPAVLALCAEALSGLAADIHVRLTTGGRPTLWEALSALLNARGGGVGAGTAGGGVPAGSLGEDVLNSLLGLLICLTPDLSNQLDVSHALSRAAVKLAVCCTRLLTCGLPGVEMRATGALSHLLPPGGPAVNAACEAGVIPALAVRIQGDDAVTRKAAVKVLAACTRHQEESRQMLLNTPKALSAVVSLLKEEDESVVGNAALCLSHVTGEARVAARLTKTNIVQYLLIKARDGIRPQLQHNCAILLAKLAQADQRHLERLRELHGVDILVDVMRHQDMT